MSWWIEDRKGFVADIATNSGLAQLRRHGPQSVKQFLSTGSADARLAERMLSELPDGDLREALKRAVPPLVLTDGVSDD